jgi:hypothetical protein
VGKQIVWTDRAKADIRGIEQAIAIQVLKTLGRYVLSGEGATKQLKGITPPLIRVRAPDYRVFFREHGDTLKIERVLDRKEALLLDARLVLLGKENPNASAARTASGYSPKRKIERMTKLIEDAAMGGRLEAARIGTSVFTLNWPYACRASTYGDSGFGWTDLRTESRLLSDPVDGWTIHADFYGTGDRCVVLAHGGRFEKGSWEKQARALVKAGFCALAIDLRGFGLSKEGPQAARADFGSPLRGPRHLPRPHRKRPKFHSVSAEAIVE